jgi:hypothetical protein
MMLGDLHLVKHLIHPAAAAAEHVNRCLQRHFLRRQRQQQLYCCWMMSLGCLRISDPQEQA